MNVQMISQGASKVLVSQKSSENDVIVVSNEQIMCFSQVNMSLIVNDNEAEECVKALHYSFFESGEMELDAALSNGKAEAVPASY